MGMAIWVELCFYGLQGHMIYDKGLACMGGGETQLSPLATLYKKD